MNKTTIENSQNIRELILEYVKTFIDTELDGNNDKINVKENFTFMIYYISERLNIDIYNLNIQNTVFQTYIYLCMKYNVIPVIRIYLNMIHMDWSTYIDWRNGVNVSSDYTMFSNSIHDICQSYVENGLTNSDKTNINLMFISKAVYGYTETSPIQRIEKIDIQVNDLSAISNRYSNIKSIECNDE
jgi:hypothetical protein